MGKKQMNDEDKKEILLDVRESSYKRFIEEKNYITRQKMYVDMKNDAEKWQLAINSYNKYFFKKNEDLGNYIEKKYKDNEEIRGKIEKYKIGLTADVLTGTTYVINNEDKINDAILQAFLKVSYSIGNMSPVWVNIGGRGGINDNIWSKLENDICYIKKGINIQENIKVIDDEGLITFIDRINDLAERKKNHQLGARKTGIGMFMIIPRISPRENIKELRLQDYFDEKWDLICDEEIFSDEGLKKITKLIIMRGYRIVMHKDKNDDTYTEEEKEDIIELFNEVGMDSDKGEEDDSIFEHIDKKKKA